MCRGGRKRGLQKSQTVAKFLRVREQILGGKGSLLFLTGEKKVRLLVSFLFSSLSANEEDGKIRGKGLEEEEEEEVVVVASKRMDRQTRAWLVAEAEAGEFLV